MTAPAGTGAPADGTVGKALDVMDKIAGFGRPVRFAELLAQSAHPKATLYRLVQTLTNQGMLRYDADRQTYAPGLRLVRLAHAAWQQSSLAPIARPFIDQLSDAVGETIHLAQLDEGQVLYVDKRNARRPVEMFSEAGKVGPGYCTGVGKAMLAFLGEDERDQAVRMQSFFPHTSKTLSSAGDLLRELQFIRRDGVAFDHEEHEPGIICIATPILGPAERVLGAISITASTRHHSLKDLEDHTPALIQTAARITQAAESWQFPA